MIQYSIGSEKPSTQFLDIEISLSTEGKRRITLSLPAWRPGRYEIGNFAMNIRGFHVLDENNKAIRFQKISKDDWVLHVSSSVKTLIVRYQYYANRMDAGSCWLDDEQMYVNPVHCCMYVRGREEEKISLRIKSKHSGIAGALPKGKKRSFVFNGFDHLADTPFIASSTLHRIRYKHRAIAYNIWIQGSTSLSATKLKKDFLAFTEQQVKLFGDIPCREYHFLIQATHHRFYHGVEHSSSTVLAIGPAADLHKKELYKELMGVASHELFHVWNVKNIRPAAMLPYDFSKENYSELGFVYEGFTTYYGDLMLAKSSFFTVNNFLKELSVRLQKHMSNHGRYNYSVLESSMDSWLDGYVPGIPWRKTSIYDEGCLIALALDLNIRLQTKNRCSLDDVMKDLYKNFGKKKTGYKLQDIITLCSTYAGVSMKSWFESLVAVPVSYIDEISRLVVHFGCRIVWTPEENKISSLYGFRYTIGEDEWQVSAIEPDSPALESGLMKGDRIVKINRLSNMPASVNEMTASIDKPLNLLVMRNGRKLKLSLSAGQQIYYKQYRIVTDGAANKEAKRMQSQWLGPVT